jgi:Domain of unknown function (DUF4124)
MRKWLILLSAFVATTASSAPAWTWVDANGQTHFSDRPVEGARQVELSGAQGFGVPTTARTTRPTNATETPGALYQVDIVSPAEQETLWNIGAQLNVQIRIQPQLQPGHRYDLALDGQRRNLNTTNPRLTLPNVFRGSHTLQLVIIDAAGAELLRSANRTFVVQQTSTQNPNSAIARPPAAGN